MTFDSSSPANRSNSPSSDLPDAPRPRPEVWTALREEGIQWDGQALIVGQGVEIPAYLVLTLDRLVLASAGEVMLDVPRDWLRPEPRLLAENGVRISMTPSGTASRSIDSDQLTIRVRSGRGGAARLVSTISGRLVSPRPQSTITRSSDDGPWNRSVGAASPMALPPLPDFDEPRAAKSAQTWPPIEQHGVPSKPVPPRTQRARPSSGTATSSSVPAAALATPATHTITPASNLRSAFETQAVEPVARRHWTDRAAVWGLRTLILAILVGTAVYFGYDRIQSQMNLSLPNGIEQRLGLTDQSPTQVGSNGDTIAESTQVDSDGTNGAPNGDTVAQSTSDSNGVGGDNGEKITPVDPGIGTYGDDAELPAEPTTVPEPTTAPEPTAELPAGATNEPATEAPATEAPVTEEPTNAPATEAPATEEPTDVPATEAPAPEEPTDEPATETPAAEVPATQVPETVEPATPTVEPATETPAPTTAPTDEATLESQSPSVAEGSPPAQEVANGSFRYSITGVSQGAMIADVPELAATSTGEWVVVTLSGENWSSTQQVFDMSQFRLYADGQETLLDVGTQWVASQLGAMPAYGNTDSILWAADESHSLALTFLVPNGTKQLTLVNGDKTIDLTPTRDAGQPLTMSTTTVAPDYLEATVVEVIDAETIVIEKDGIRQTVRYLGVSVPKDDDCYATEATDLNRTLVEGKTVRIERQATDVDARGNWVRDVWVAGDNGTYSLVSEAMVAQGGATVAISEPNTRFASWLMGTQSVAKGEERGIWGSCDQPASSTSLPDPAQAVVDTPQAVNSRRAKR